MRVIRTTTISILALGLLAGSAVGVAAQDEADPMAPSTFTWSYGDASNLVGEVIFRADGAEGYTVVALDPRASGEMTHEQVDDDIFEAIEADEPNLFGLWESRLVNDGGSWVGIGRKVGVSASLDESDNGWSSDLMVHELTGEGGYDGLSLILFDPYVYLFMCLSSAEALASSSCPDSGSLPPFGTFSNPWGVIYPSEPLAE